MTNRHLGHPKAGATLSPRLTGRQTGLCKNKAHYLILQQELETPSSHIT